MSSDSQHSLACLKSDGSPPPELEGRRVYRPEPTFASLHTFSRREKSLISSTEHHIAADTYLSWLVMMWARVGGDENMLDVDMKQ